jgi:hypothetical protein
VTDVLTLLSDANPVRPEEVPRMDAALPDAILARGRRPQRRLVLAVAVVAAALAAGLVGVFAFDRTNAPPRGTVPTGLQSSVGSPPTVDHPLLGAKQVSLAAAATAIGRPIVLPDTSLVGASDAGPAWVNGALPAVTAAVTFPSEGMFIEYTLPPPADPTATYQAIAREDPRTFETVVLNGGTALAVKQDSDQTGRNFGGVIFVLNGVEIRVFGHYDEATLQTVAQSIVDRSQTQ